MHSPICSTVVVAGRVGIVDAALVSCLEGIKKRTKRLLVHVTDTIYNGIIPKIHIEGFVANLSVVDGILEEESEARHIVQQAGRTLIHLPEEELRQYSFERILKKIDIENSKNEPENNKLISLKELVTIYGDNPHQRKINVGLVSGSFDLIHWGHHAEIKAAKEIANVVIVATMSTNSIKQQKKNIIGDRPIYSQEDRIKVLSSLRTVDHVVVFEELDCKDVIRTIRPNYFVKHEKDISRRIVKEECELVKSSGGKVIVTKDVAGYSSTDIIDYVRSTNCEEG